MSRKSGISRSSPNFVVQVSRIKRPLHLRDITIISDNHQYNSILNKQIPFTQLHTFLIEAVKRIQLLDLVTYSQGSVHFQLIKHGNRSFWSYLEPLFQNKSSCKTSHYEMNLICMKIKLRGRTHFYMNGFTKTRFDKETKGN